MRKGKKPILNSEYEQIIPETDIIKKEDGTI
jgi:hypothetical protein